MHEIDSGRPATALSTVPASSVNKDKFTDSELPINDVCLPSTEVQVGINLCLEVDFQRLSMVLVYSGLRKIDLSQGSTIPRLGARQNAQAEKALGSKQGRKYWKYGEFLARG